MCYGWFGQLAEEKVNEKLKKDLQAAHMEQRAGAYLAVGMFSSLIGFIATAAFFCIFIFQIFKKSCNICLRKNFSKCLKINIFGYKS